MVPNPVLRMRNPTQSGVPDRCVHMDDDEELRVPLDAMWTDVDRQPQ